MSAFSLEIGDSSAGRKTLRVKGLLNENAKLPDFDASGLDEVIIDFDEMKGLNSVGIRSWIYWIPQIPAARLVNCPYFLVQQFVMVKGMLPDRFRVDSIKLPVICDGCDREEKVLLDLNVLRADSKGFDAHDFVRRFVCTTSPCDLEPDFFEQTVDKFVKSQLGTSSFPE